MLPQTGYFVAHSMMLLPLRWNRDAARFHQLVICTVLGVSGFGIGVVDVSVLLGCEAVLPYNCFQRFDTT